MYIYIYIERERGGEKERGGEGGWEREKGQGDKDRVHVVLCCLGPGVHKYLFIYFIVTVKCNHVNN